MRVYAAVATGLLLVNCGGSSRREVLPRVSAGAGGVEAAPATPAAGLGGAGVGGQPGSTPVLMGVGGTSAGGTSAGGASVSGTSAGGASVGGASAGGISGSSMAGGVGAWQSWLGDGGAPPVEGDGFGCGSGRCAAGELCIGCIVPKVTTRLQCVPDPRRDPDGYAATVAMDCMHPGGYVDCDGPEDCPSGSYCVLGAVGLAYGAQCQAELPAPDRNCCFDCDSVVLPLCILCAGDSDCPPGNVCVPPPAGYEPNAGGCEPAPSSGG